MQELETVRADRAVTSHRSLAGGKEGSAAAVLAARKAFVAAGKNAGDAEAPAHR